MQPCRDLLPSPPHRLPGIPIHRHGTLEQRRIYRFHYLSQGDEVGRPTQQIAARLATAAVDESGTPQIIENLHKKVRRYCFTLRKVIKPCKSSPVMVFRQLSQRSAGVFQFL